jgi:predicted small lipoprotein YifL
MLLLSACGLKGDLVLPDASATPAATPASNAPEPDEDPESEDEGDGA